MGARQASISARWTSGGENAQTRGPLAEARRRRPTTFVIAQRTGSDRRSHLEVYPFDLLTTAGIVPTVFCVSAVTAITADANDKRF